MGYTDQDGNWIEDFKSMPYPTEQDAKNKIQAVFQFHCVEGADNGWRLREEPRIEKTGAGYVAIIPLLKEKQSQR